MSMEVREKMDMERLVQLAEEKQYRQLKEALLEFPAVDVAAFMEELDSERTVIVFRMLPKDLAMDVFAELPVENQQHIINSITDQELSEIMEELYVDDAVDMVEELPAAVVRRVLKSTTPDTRKLINQFLNYPENSAGSIMTAEYVGLKKTMTVEECFAYIRKHAVDSETIYTCYVMDEGRHLDGVVTVKDLLMNPYETKVGDIMDTHVIKAYTTEDQEQVADTMNKYDLLSLPVVDSEDRLVGIVTVDDVMDVLILMLSSTITGGILLKYENAFAAVPLLVSFVPMLMDTGGNCGSQSSTMIIRGMAVGEIAVTDILRVVWKEVRVGVLVGVVLSLVNFIRLMLQYPGNTMICLTVVLSLFCTVVAAKTIGCVLPIAAKTLKMDPAIMASPLITTIVDAVSLMVYFDLACRLLDMAA